MGTVACDLWADFDRLLVCSSRLKQRPFAPQPVVASHFGEGSPTKVSQAPGEYVFSVSSAGHYSVELFGQDDDAYTLGGLNNTLLVFIDDAAADADDCPAPTGEGKLYRFHGPGKNAAGGTASWADTGYYAFDAMTLKAGDAVCVERGAWVEGHLVAAPGCVQHNVRVAGKGVWSGQSLLGKTPHDDRRPLLQFCGANITVTGLTTVNSQGPNVELTPYWANGYRNTLPGRMREMRGGNKVHNVKVLQTWWYSAYSGEMHASSIDHRRYSSIDPSICFCLPCLSGLFD